MIDVSEEQKLNENSPISVIELGIENDEEEQPGG